MNIYSKFLLAAVLLLLTISTNAQLNPLNSQFFGNTYLGNPAFAGYDKGLNINAIYRNQWSSFPGAPIIQNLTVDYSKSKAALGLNINFEKGGLQRQSRVVGTFAYHLPLSSNEQFLHFGLSLGFMNQFLSNNDIVGNIADPQTVAYNQRETYLDGDFGIGFTSSNLRLEAAIPNLKTIFKRDDVNIANLTTFYTAASYKIELTEGEDGVELEPKLVYRGFRKLSNIWDLGSQLSLANKQVLLTAIYHSSKSTSFGIGLDYRRRFLISSFYTTQTSSLNNYTNGAFEINLRGRF